MFRSPSGDGNLASLDVLRGLAIIAVLIAHFSPAVFRAPTSLTLLFGQFGVILFFFLSGLLMDRTYANEPQLVPYFVRRSFRILPMYWLSILLIFATEHGWTLRDVTSNAIFATGPMHVVRMSGVYWTLYIEVLFYATVPLIVFAGERAILLSSYLAIGLFGTLWLFDVRSGIAPHYMAYCYVGLQFGAWLRKVISGAALLASVLTVVVVASILPIVSPFPDVVSPFLGIAPLACAVLLYLALCFPFRMRPIEFCGDISYSLNLLHAIVLSQVGAPVLSYGYASWIAVVLSIGLSIALSVLTLGFVERPAITVGRQIVRRWRALVARQQTAKTI
jgi:peptidoglycan/LPS O-acetylase OafA/YrhL